jgi:hypothetical protein
MKRILLPSSIFSCVGRILHGDTHSLEYHGPFLSLLRFLVLAAADLLQPKS